MTEVLLKPIWPDKGMHLGPVSADPAVQTEIERTNFLGFWTITRTHYEHLLQSGVEPLDVRKLA